MGEGGVVPRKTKTELSSAAVFAFVLGLLSCFSCGFGVVPGVPALILGLIVIFRWRKTVTYAVNSGLAVGGMLLACFGIAVCFGWLPKAWMPRDPHRPECQHFLKNIGVILRMYADENEGAFPDKLSVLYPEYVSGIGLDYFVCPESGNEPGDPAHIDEWSDYTYVRGLRPTHTPADADVPVCYDKDYTHHTPRGRNELYLDGHVELHRLGKPSQSSEQTHP